MVRYYVYSESIVEILKTLLSYPNCVARVVSFFFLIFMNTARCDRTLSRDLANVISSRGYDATRFSFNTSPLDVSFLRKKSRFLYSRQNVNGRSRACVCEHGSGQIFFFFAVLSAVSFHSRNPSTNFLSVFLSFLVFFYSFIFLSFFLLLIRRLFSVISTNFALTTYKLHEQEIVKTKIDFTQRV